VTYAPARIFSGFSVEVFAAQVALQLAWMAALVVVVAAIYTRAVRKVNIHGG